MIITTRRMKARYILYIILFVTSIVSCSPDRQDGNDGRLARVEPMPDHPSPYKMIDWHDKAVNFDEIIFNHQNKGDYQPFIWLDSAGRNFPQTTFGLFTVIGDVRQGPGVNHGEFHEAINSMGALMSAGLVGIDKTNQQEILVEENLLTQVVSNERMLIVSNDSLGLQSATQNTSL